ncbi:MAG: universal stress protein [Halobacteriovoraceae bacterium]|mgnify:CR=1 FL=1|nr:universal stress protein [Halobacteriovoraceae bacterium]MBT5094391.1 universal stress protein [Halobacteriovoraceae bacterium]
MKKIVICTNLDPASTKAIESLVDQDLLKDSQVELLHCFETQIYTGEYFINYYPTEEQYPAIEGEVLEILAPLDKKLSSIASVNSKCIFSTNPKEEVKEFLNREKPDLLIVATRGVTGFAGLFNSSFADYMLRHSPCDVLVLRPR